MEFDYDFDLVIWSLILFELSFLVTTFSSRSMCENSGGEVFVVTGKQSKKGAYGIEVKKK